MSVFISYNHRDAEFADRVALELVRQNVKVWKDKWRIRVGDSLLDKIQQGLEDARYLCLVCSEHSLMSEWVKREINASLLREIEEKQVVLLPLVIDDCKLPLLLRDKLFADFRRDFNTGLAALLRVVSKQFDSGSSGEVEMEDRYFIHYSIETQEENDRYSFQLNAVSFDLEESYSILLILTFQGTEHATTANLGVRGAKDVLDLVLDACDAEFKRTEPRVKLHADEPHVGNVVISDAEAATLFYVHVEVRTLGSFTGDTVLFNLGATISQIRATRATHRLESSAEPR